MGCLAHLSESKVFWSHAEGDPITESFQVLMMCVLSVRQNTQGVERHKQKILQGRVHWRLSPWQGLASLMHVHPLAL